MNIEELLKPRYEVIALYPYSPFEIGEILLVDEHGELYGKEYGYRKSSQKVSNSVVQNYPHIFKPLQWWERREESEMPKYVKYDGKPSKVVSIEWTGFDQMKQVEYNGKDLHLDNQFVLKSFRWSELIPATQEEYDNYINLNK